MEHKMKDIWEMPHAVAYHADDATRALYEAVNALESAVNAECSCGGSGPSDPNACPACMVWNRFISSTVTC